MSLSAEFKTKVAAALIAAQANQTGSDSAFAKRWGMNASVYNRIKNGETDNILAETKWLTLGREFGVTLNDRKWNMAKTDVFTAIENDVLTCKNNAKAMILVDDCEIGKTFTAKYLSKTLPNCFYLDCSESKTKLLFIRALAKAIGIDSTGKFNEVKANVKYYLNSVPQPVVIVDEAGDLEYTAFLCLKEFWNATENACGWYMMGADGLQHKIKRGIENKKIGYREIFSRYSGKFMKIVPSDRSEKIAFYKKLIGDVLYANMKNKTELPVLVNKCLASMNTGDTAGLRRAETLLILNQAA